MARPARNAPQENVLSSSRTFFATTKTHAGQRILQSERNANLLIDVLRSYMVWPRRLGSIRIATITCQRKRLAGAKARRFSLQSYGTAKAMP